MTQESMIEKKQTGAGSVSAGTLVAAIIVVGGLVLTVMRFTRGLGAVTNLDNNNPWGIWIGFDLLCGVALAAGGYMTSGACYIFGLKRYHTAVRPAILTAFLGYALVVVALTYDVGRPWRLPYPFFVSQGTSSLLFEVALCVGLYLTVLFIEFSPAALEWLGWRRVRDLVIRLVLALTIFGVILSTLHQSSLGALFLIAPSKLHPLWYTPYLPVLFFVSSMYAGLSMVIMESSLSMRFLSSYMDTEHAREADGLALGFARGAAFIMMGYTAVQFIGLAVDNDWRYLATGWGAWYLFELIGFVVLPAFAYAIGVREKNAVLVRWVSLWAVLGIVLNRLNVSIVAFNWRLPRPERYLPSWMEIWTTLFIITAGVLAYLFIVTRMPVFHEHPEYSQED